MEPLAFAILPARTPAHIECTLFDERIEPVPLDLDTDLVAISVETLAAAATVATGGVCRRELGVGTGGQTQTRQQFGEPGVPLG